MTQALRYSVAFTKTGALEFLRRKDIYVVAILMLLMVLGAATFGFFGVKGLATFIRDVTFSVVGLFTALLTVLISSRQISEEISRKTIYPILARPITRWQFLLGKWFSAWLISSVAFVALALIGAGMLLIFSIPVGPIFFQYVILKVVGTAWLAAVTIALTVCLTPAAATTISLIIAFGSAAFGRTIVLMNADSPMSSFALNLLYSVLPHYDYFDLGAKVTYAWPPVPWWTIALMCAYSITNGAVWLGASWLKFRKQVV